MKYGFLRETKEDAIKAGIDKVTKLNRTGLDEYLSVIFPNTIDWIHDKIFPNNEKKRYRPDYRSESLKLIVEFDGILHYQNPENIFKDQEKTTFYEKYGYKVVRIPYFIQLTKKSVKTLFDIDLNIELFDENIPSLSIEEKCSPAFLCPLGIKRMAKEFLLFPEQYNANINALKKYENVDLSGVDLLINEYNLISSPINLEHFLK